MHSSIFFTVFAGIVGITTASPTESNTDPTVCAPGTGFFQSCSNGFRGCCTADACTIGYCPDVTVTSSKTAIVTATPVPEHKAHWQPETVSDPTVCKPGTGFFQSCSNGFRGCCKEDACTLGYCPPASEKRDETVCFPNTGFFQSCANGFRGCCKGDACTLGYCPDVPATVVKRDDPTVCAPGTGFFQSCSNGFRGCCKSDACTLGYCPSTTEKRQDPTVCAPGTGFFQSCSNGFRGCCKADACTLGYCPSTTEKRQDPTVCAPGTGFFQSCSNGFRGCCKADACTIGYCPDLKFREPTVKRDETVCAPGTGFFQSCSNGFRGCCKQDACTIGYCPDVKSFETVTIAPKTSPTPTPEANHEWHAEPKNTDPTVCAPGTGFFQSCSNGFRGCCKADACTIGYCPSN
ncbi:hypothetical protein COL154_006416 [Colletotrichum chrysophilum]|uniref:Uncharacterized protein n=1 Tax=Colletotrichum chrysophilum TaxID=1836956 RepID=A0AAD9ALP0_9PEZI|nr:uncharacterized protein COL26b_006037 [Colletotrichum chrysophilum]KAJ0348536.1 hypothetical protein KNSL1_005483 [Colletotrichum chrysophilum]KAJ0362108.1 hypothetical protein COL154_006416 [Colletotrichum chrysophilum]KAJ0375717.1 hypothetical protein COL26b_006037 [Colletotrichum chrysophilum]KAK1850491.1 hypothetical protein CCHR01_06894 [Colletotrichum chrysophilum]